MHLYKILSKVITKSYIRASLHEEFGRKLMKHAKASIGREETG